METLMKSDIFFFVSTIESIFLTIAWLILLYYLITAGRNLHRLSEALKEKLDDSSEFLAELYERLEGNFIFRFLFPSRKNRKR